MNSRDWQITNATLVDADGVRATSGLHISGGRLENILGSGEEIGELLNLNLHGLTVLPGLINSHDSLLATYEAFIDPDQVPYLNWLAYDNQLKASALFKERMLVPVEDLYRLGALRNAVAGVTTVADHIPHFVRQPFQNLELPVRLLPDFGISHSICTYSLDWGDGPRAEYERAAEAGLPYITHIAEGLDPESQTSLRRLEREGGLGEHTVLVHGIGLSPDDFDLIAKRKASIVWCPVTNQALYGRTLAIREALDRDINVCLGSDAAMFGSPNLLADIRAAARLLEESELDPAQVLPMVSRNAAQALRIAGGELAEDRPADFVVLQGRHPSDPIQSLMQAEATDVYLVVRGGVPVYGDESLERMFTELGVIFDRVEWNGSRKIVAAGTKKLLESIRGTVGRSEEFYFLTGTTG